MMAVFETFLINILSCFGDMVSEFPLTYHCELIDGDSGQEGGGERLP